MRFRLGAGLSAVVAATPAAADGRPHIRLEFRGQAILPTGTTFSSTVVGGLSSIAYDARRDNNFAATRFTQFLLFAIK